MIILVGESACGKSSIEKVLVNKYGYDKTVSYTTRPPRDGEIDGVDYNFITEDEFIEKNRSGYFVEIGAYNGWFYGTTKKQYTDKTVCVLTPHGLRQIQKKLKDENVNICSFYINVPRRDRLIQILKRGDDIDESIRRNQSDVGQFDGIEDEVTHVLNNPKYKNSPVFMADLIIDIIDSFKGDNL